MRDVSRWLVIAFAALPVLAGCPAPEGDGDGDGDSDGDGDGGGECPDGWACCSDRDCSDQVYCNGVEICDRGVCEADPDAVCSPGLGCQLVCEDGFECTEDSCDELANICVHVPRHERCDDGDRCNGVERCAAAEDGADERGCVHGMPIICDDGDACTEDYCVDNECRVRLRDADGDGFGDEDCEICDPDDPRDCEEGTDCDDSNDTVYPGAEEICDDGVDNNCDRIRDYADPSCTVPYDSCETALLLHSGGLIHGSTRGTSTHVDSSCSAPEAQDAVFAFSISEVQDVEVTVTGRGGRSLTAALTADCGNADADLKCTSGREFTQITRALAPGTYFVIVSGELEVDFDIGFEHGDPVERPEGDQCATAVDVSTGGSFTGTTTGFDADYGITCGADPDRDATFVFTLDETSAVDILVEPEGDVEMAVAVQSTCGVPTTEWDCFAGSPVEGRVGSLPPGTYHVIVKSSREVDFSLDIGFVLTSADACAAVRDITAARTVFGTTAGMAADIDTACGDPIGPDSAYRFTLREEQDVTIDFRSDGEPTSLSLTTECGDPDAEVRCSSGETFQLRGRGLAAGTYYLVATGSEGADFEMDIARRDPVPRPAYDLCSGAIEIPGSGMYRGDTFDCENDYESRCGSSTDVDMAFVFTIDEPRSVDISMEADAGPIAVAIQSACGVVGTERSCFSSVRGSTHRYYRNIDAGRYYLVFKTPAPDSFAFEITFGAPEPTVMMPWIDPSGHTAEVIDDWGVDDGQFNFDIAPLSFPFNGSTYGCVALSTNGYIRFGPPGRCPRASGLGTMDTDPDEAFGAGNAQISWLGADGYVSFDSRVTHFVDPGSQQVIITFLDYRHLGAMESEMNDVQIILSCDTGDIQISYGDCSFDAGGWGHWGMGVSEPAHGGSAQLIDFPAQAPGSMVSFGPGAISQSPEYTDAAEYAPLRNRAIFFQRSGTGWDVLVDDLPL